MLLARRRNPAKKASAFSKNQQSKNGSAICGQRARKALRVSAGGMGFSTFLAGDAENSENFRPLFESRRKSSIGRNLIALGDGVLEGANDEELLRWGLAGDREALGAFVSRHADTLGRVLAGRHPRSVQTEDLVAETFIEAIVGLEGWQESYGTPIAWLQGIAKNLCRDEWLRAQREAEARKHLGELAIAKAATDDLEETPFDESHVNALRTCLRKLDVTERECVEMHVIQGRTWNEVGEALARTPNAARKLAEKVCAALARCVRRTLGDVE